MDRPDTREPMLLAYLSDRDEPCPGCGYNLRALTTDHCPECNQQLALRVGLVEPRMGWFLAAVIGASAGLGLNLLLLIYIVISPHFYRGGPPSILHEYFFWHNLIGGVVHGACVSALLRNGPKLRRLPRAWRITIAGIMWALSLVNIAMFSRFVN